MFAFGVFGDLNTPPSFQYLITITSVTSKSKNPQVSPHADILFTKYIYIKLPIARQGKFAGYSFFK
jgi:hypothetical protein